MTTGIAPAAYPYEFGLQYEGQREPDSWHRPRWERAIDHGCASHLDELIGIVDLPVLRAGFVRPVSRRRGTSEITWCGYWTTVKLGSTATLQVDDRLRGEPWSPP